MINWDWLLTDWLTKGGEGGWTDKGWCSGRNSSNACMYNSTATCDKLIDLPLQWHHNERYGISNHLRLDCLLNRLFRLRWAVDSPHKGPVTQKMFPLDDVIITPSLTVRSLWHSQSSPDPSLSSQPVQPPSLPSRSPKSAKYNSRCLAIIFWLAQMAWCQHAIKIQPSDLS